MRGFESWALSYLLNSFWQVPLLFAAGWVAARALRGAGAAAEHRVWVGVLLLEGLLPALSTMRWGWLSAISILHGRGLDASETHVAVVMGSGTVAGGLHVTGALLAAVAMAYAAITAYFAARFAWRWRRLRSLRLNAVEMTLAGEMGDCWSRCAERFGIRRAMVTASADVFGPVTMGFRRKLVLLPVGMISGAQDVDIQTVIAHEFAHMRRNDFCKNLMYELLSLAVNYHPLTWLTRERLTESREIVCDEVAAEVGGRAQYARSLLRIASLLTREAPARSSHAIGFFDTRTFERRIMRLAKKQSEMQGVRRWAAVVACVAFGIAACGTAFALSMHVDAGATIVQDHPTKAPKVIKVSPQVIAGNRIGGNDPKYPIEAKKEKVQGTVVLNAVISKDGSIEKLTVVSGPKELRKSAADAVRTWKYKPYLLNGQPVRVETAIHVTYSLGK